MKLVNVKNVKQDSRNYLVKCNDMPKYATVKDAVTGDLYMEYGSVIVLPDALEE